VTRSADLERFFELSLDLLCIAGLDGFFRRVNPAFERTLGWSDGELLEHPFLDFVHPDDRAATERELARLSDGRETLSFENRYRTVEGTYRWLRWTAHPETGSGEIFAVARDVTEERTVEERYRGALEASPCAMLQVDGRGRIELVNREVERLFGYRREELLGQPVEQLVPQRAEAEHVAFRDGYLREPRARPMGSGREVTARRRDGHEFPVQIGLTPVDIDGGRSVLAAIVDVSDRVEAERRIRRQAEELAAMNRSLQLVATTDPLTEVLNRRAFTEQLDNQLRLAWRLRKSLTLMVLELGDYATYRRTLGEEVGDRVLRDFGRILRDESRKTDFAARLGDDEFSLILPLTDTKGSRIVGSRIVARVEAYPFPERALDVRIGIATLEASTFGAEYVERAGSRLLSAAMRALDSARRRGGTRFVHAEDPSTGEIPIRRPD